MRVVQGDIIHLIIDGGDVRIMINESDLGVAFLDQRLRRSPLFPFVRLNHSKEVVTLVEGSVTIKD